MKPDVAAHVHHGSVVVLEVKPKAKQWLLDKGHVKRRQFIPCAVVVDYRIGMQIVKDANEAGLEISGGLEIIEVLRSE